MTHWTQTVIDAHRDAARFYGVQPLSNTRVRELAKRGFPEALIYGVACDVANGWTFKQSVEAADRYQLNHEKADQ